MVGELPHHRGRGRHGAGAVEGAGGVAPEGEQARGPGDRRGGDGGGGRGRRGGGGGRGGRVGASAEAAAAAGAGWSTGRSDAHAASRSIVLPTRARRRRCTPGCYRRGPRGTGTDGGGTTLRRCSAGRRSIRPTGTWGPRWSRFGGWEMPLAYPSGTLAEHRTCRTGAVVFDVSHLGSVRVAGPGAFDRLQRTLTNDLGRIAPGRAQYTHLLDEADGSVLDDIIVWWVNATTSSTSCPTRPTPSGWCEAVGGEDVTASRAIIAVQGPEARRWLADVAPEAADVPRFHVRRFTWQGVTAYSAGTGYTGEDGVEVAIPAAGRARLLGGPARRRPPARRGWAPGTRSAWRPACPSTATSWAPASRPCRPTSAGSWPGTRAPSGGGRRWRRSGRGASTACSPAWRWRVASRPGPGTPSSAATGPWARSAAATSRPPSAGASPSPSSGPTSGPATT